MNYGNDFLPLYINEGEPINVYIIANRIILFEEEIASIGNSLTAFRFLQELFENAKTRTVLPEKIIQVFNEMERKGIKFPKDLCLFGRSPKVEQNHVYCLTMKMSYESEGKQIKLSNFARIEKSNKFLLNAGKDTVLFSHIQDEIFLPTEDFLILFGNINTMKSGLGLLSGDFNPFNVDILQKKIENIYKNQNTEQRDQGYYSYMICLFYLDYLIQKIDKNEINIERILSLNGAGVLALLAKSPKVESYIKSILTELKTNQHQLPLNKKIQYYLLVVLTNYLHDETISYITDFITKNETILGNILKELENKVYYPKYEIADLEKVYNKYQI